MKVAAFGIALAASAGLVSSASAAVTFSNISVTGGIAGTPTTFTGTNDIDAAFAVNAATVGDPTNLFGTEMITFSYTVTATGETINAMVLSLLGAAAGSGAVEVQTSIVNAITNDPIASNTLEFDTANPPPVFSSVNFGAPHTAVRVVHMIHLSATNTAGFDLAQLSLIEARYTPTPGALALLGLGGLVAGRRRR